MRLKPLTSGLVIFVGIFAMMTTVDIQGVSLTTNDLVNQREHTHIIKPPHESLLVSDELRVATGQVAWVNLSPLSGPGAENVLDTRLINRGIDGITQQAHSAEATCIVLIPASFNLDYEYLGSPDNPDDCQAGYVDENTGAWEGGFYCDEDAEGYYCPFGDLIQDTTDYQYYCRIESDC